MKLLESARAGVDTAAQAAGPRMPALDGLRGIAVMLVVLLHLDVLVPDGPLTFLRSGGIFRAGFLGVDVFFVLSGFLITDLLVRSARRDGRVDLRAFWRARAFRLLPALLVMLGSYIAWSALTGFPSGSTPEIASRNIVVALTFTTNWLATTDLSGVAVDLGHLWSLAVEEQFYVVWPIVVAALLRIRRASFVAVLLAVGVVAVAVRRGGLFEEHGWVVAYVRTDARVDGLLIGALVAWTTANGRTWRTRWASIAGSAGSAALIVIMLVVPSASEPFLYYGGSTVVAIATAAILIAIVDGAWARQRVLCWRPLRALGRVSYGLYLWHLPIFRAVERSGASWPGWLRVAAGVGTTALATVGSWFLVERPTQALRRRADAAARQRRHVGLGRIPWVCVGAGAASIAVAASAGRLAWTARPGGALRDAQSLRSIAFLQFSASPPRTQLLADAYVSGTATRFDGSRLLPALARLPAVALQPSLHTWLTGASVAAASAGVVLASLALRSQILRRRAVVNRHHPWARSSAIVIAVGVLAVGVLPWRVPAADLEVGLWSAAASLAWLAALVALASRVRLAEISAVVSTTLLVALASRTNAWVALCVCGGGVVVAAARVRAKTAATFLVAAALPALVAFAPPSTGDATPSPAGVGWQLPRSGTPDDLFALADCGGLYGASSQSGAWRSGSRPASVLDVTFASQPTRDGSVTVLSVFGGEPGSLLLESASDRRVRFGYLDVDRPIARTPWFLVLPGDVQRVVVVEAGGSLEIRARGQSLARFPLRDATTGATATVTPTFTDARRATGAKITWRGRAVQFPELCRATMAVAAESAMLLAVPPARSLWPRSAQRLAVIGDCDMLLSRTGSSGREWSVVEARPLDMLIEFQVGVSAGTWVVARDRTGSEARIAVDSDGAGRVRFRIGVPFFETVTRWHAAPTEASPMSLRVDYNGPVGAYDVSVAGRYAARFDAFAPASDGSAETAVRLFASDPSGGASPGGDVGPDVEVLDTYPTPVCSQALDRWHGELRRVANLDDAGAVRAGTVAVIGDCRAAYVASGDADAKWGRLHTAPVTATVTYPRGAEEVGVTTAIDVSSDPLMNVVVETDGEGRRRFRVKVPFLSADGPWRRVDSSTRDVVMITWKASTDELIVFVNGSEVGRLPASAVRSEVSTVPLLASVHIEFVPGLGGELPPALVSRGPVERPDDLCRRLLRQHDDPTPGSSRQD